MYGFLPALILPIPSSSVTSARNLISLSDVYSHLRVLPPLVDVCGHDIGKH